VADAIHTKIFCSVVDAGVLIHLLERKPLPFGDLLLPFLLQEKEQ
jgi:hypothetical protein